MAGGFSGFPIFSSSSQSAPDADPFLKLMALQNELRMANTAAGQQQVGRAENARQFDANLGQQQTESAQNFALGQQRLGLQGQQQQAESGFRQEELGLQRQGMGAAQEQRTIDNTRLMRNDAKADERYEAAQNTLAAERNRESEDRGVKFDAATIINNDIAKNGLDAMTADQAEVWLNKTVADTPNPLSPKSPKLQAALREAADSYVKRKRAAEIDEAEIGVKESSSKSMDEGRKASEAGRQEQRKLVRHSGLVTHLNVLIKQRLDLIERLADLRTTDADGRAMIQKLIEEASADIAKIGGQITDLDKQIQE